MSEKNKQPIDFPFTKDNYKWLVIGVCITVLGYILMIGGGSDDPNVFSEDVFSPVRITIAPLVILAGLGVCGYAIMKKDKNKTE